MKNETLRVSDYRNPTPSELIFSISSKGHS